MESKSIQAEVSQEAWNVHRWMKSDDPLGKEAQAIGNAGNPDYDPNNPDQISSSSS